MTENDIKGNFLALKNLVAEAAGEDLPEREKQVIKLLCETGLSLLEGLLVDINKLATAAEHLVYHK